MRSKLKTVTCPKCGRAVRVRCQVPCHGVHLLLSLATRGLWIVVWLLLAVRARICRCDLCGSPVWLTDAPLAYRIPLPNRDPKKGNRRFGAFLVENGLVYYAPTCR